MTLMTQYLRQPADPDAIRHDLGLGERTADHVDLVRAAKRLKLKAKIARPSPKRLDRLPLPIIIEKGGRQLCAAGGLVCGQGALAGSAIRASGPV
ncbi:MAG: hypothetical protein EOR04_10165 [Mesorhizobium sp.]|nr:MAG: hypothetical protein EOR04_10165 [Mesorhizobium sp.]